MKFYLLNAVVLVVSSHIKTEIQHVLCIYSYAHKDILRRLFTLNSDQPDGYGNRVGHYPAGGATNDIDGYGNADDNGYYLPMHVRPAGRYSPPSQYPSLGDPDLDSWLPRSELEDTAFEGLPYEQDDDLMPDDINDDYYQSELVLKYRFSLFFYYIFFTNLLLF